MFFIIYGVTHWETGLEDTIGCARKYLKNKIVIIDKVDEIIHKKKAVEAQ